MILVRAFLMQLCVYIYILYQWLKVADDFEKCIIVQTQTVPYCAKLCNGVNVNSHGVMSATQLYR